MPVNILYSKLVSGCSAIPQDFQYYRAYGVVPVDAVILHKVIQDERDPYYRAFTADSLIRLSKGSPLYSEIEKLDPMNTYARDCMCVPVEVSGAPSWCVGKFSDKYPVVSVEILSVSRTSCMYRFGGGRPASVQFQDADVTPDITGMGTIIRVPTDFGPGVITVTSPPAVVTIPQASIVRQLSGRLTKDIRDSIDYTQPADLAAAFCLILMVV